MTRIGNQREPLLVMGVGAFVLVAIAAILTLWIKAPLEDNGDLQVQPRPRLELPPLPETASTPNRGVQETGRSARGEEAAVGALVNVRCPVAPAAMAFASKTGDDGSIHTERARMADGLAHLRIPPQWFLGSTPLELHVGVAGAGVAKKMQVVSVCPGDTRVVTLYPEGGLALSGRVIDLAGHPVSGIRVVARTRRTQGARQPRQYETDAVLFSANPFREGRAVTAVDGTFRVRGLESSAYVLTTSDPAWVIVPILRPGVTPPMEGIELRAERSFRLHLSVSDATTHEPVPRASARIRIGTTDGGGANFSCICREGLGSVAWAPRGSAMRDGLGFELAMRVKAFGYAPRSATVRFFPGDREVSHSIELSPVPMGKLVFDITAADASPMTGEVMVRISGAYGGHVLALEKGAEPGRYLCPVPSGMWSVSVYPRGAFGIRTLSWSRHVMVPERGIKRMRVQLLPFGSLAVDRGDHRAVVLKIRVDGTRITTVIDGRHSRLSAIREGVWPYVAKAGEDGVVVQQGDIVIRAGRETALRID